MNTTVSGRFRAAIAVAAAILMTVAASSQGAARPVIEAPKRLETGRTGEIYVNPRPANPSEYLRAISAVGIGACPASLSGSPETPPGWTASLSANAGKRASGLVNAAGAEPGSRILICAYQGSIPLGVGRLIGGRSVVVAPKRVQPRQRIVKAYFKPGPYEPIVLRPEGLVPPLNGSPPYASRLLKWKNWGSPRTSSTGRVFYNTCRPACAVGYRGVRGTVVLSRIRKCRGHFRYTRAQFLYPHKRRYNVTFRYKCSGWIESYG